MNGEHYYFSNKEKKFKRKKHTLIALTLIFLLLTVVFVLFLGKNSQNTTNNYISVGICGAVNKPAIQFLPINSNLADLIKQAKGVKYNSDLRNIDLNTILQNDSIYYIPFRKESEIKLKRSIIDNIPETYYTHNDDEINILYIGYPTLFSIINYNPNTKRIVITYIPDSSLFLDNEYRLIDVFLTLGKQYTIDMLSKSLGIKIDYYFIQDKSSFINIVDKLGGVEINIDEWYAQEYGLDTGKQILDGFHSFEFMRFIEKNMRKNTLNDNSLDVAKKLRMARIKYVVKELFLNFKNGNISKQISSITEVLFNNSTETNINTSKIYELVQQVVKCQHIDFETISGFYIKREAHTYYIPTEWNSKIIRKKHKLNNLYTQKNNK